MFRKLNSVIRNRFTKCFCTVSKPKIENEVPEEQPIEHARETEILEHPDYFRVHNLFTVKDLFDARVHYGHKITSLEHNMKPFVFGSRLGHVIFDLDVTAYHLREALNFTAHIAYRDGIILFISKKPEVTLLVENTAKACNEYAVTRDWTLGTFTDSFSKFKTHIRLPDLCIILNTIEESGCSHLAITEAAKMCIPTIGIVDSNCFPNLITYPVPGNDDSYSSIKLYCELFQKAILRGKSERKKHLKESLQKCEGSDIETSSNSETNTNTGTSNTDNVKVSKEMDTKKNFEFSVE